MRTLFLVLICLSVGSFQSDAQIKMNFDVITTRYETGKQYNSEALVSVYSDSVLIDSKKIKSKKGVDFDLDYGKLYKIMVSADGIVTRFIYLDLSIPEHYNMEAIELANLSGAVQLSLFEAKSGVDYSYVLNNPLTTFSVDFENHGIIYDRLQAAVMVKKIEELMK